MTTLSRSKTKNNTVTQTIETRIPNIMTTQLDTHLMQFARHYNRAKRIMVAQQNKNTVINKSHFMKSHGLTGRQYNAIKSEVGGLFQSQLSNVERYVDEAEVKIAQCKQRIKDIDKSLNKPTALLIQTKSGQLSTQQKYINAKQGCLRKIAIKTAQINAWKLLIAQQKIKICFGSGQQFKQQFNLTENGYKTHEQWYADYDAKRNDEFFILGSRDETAGNQSCVITRSGKDEYSLRLRMPTGLEETLGKHIEINHLKFNYRVEKLNNAIENNACRKQLSKSWKNNDALINQHQQALATLIQQQDDSLAQCQSSLPPSLSPLARDNKIESVITKQNKVRDSFANYTLNNALANYGQAISYRFKRDEKGWRIMVSVSTPLNTDDMTNKQLGAIGIDLNEHHISITETDYQGCKVSSQDITFRQRKHNDNSEQTRSGLGFAIKQVIELAKKTGKPIVIESLNFNKAKSQLKSGKNKRYNKTVSSLVTARFKSIMTLRCAEHQIELIAVNPAYTSLLGRIKYGNEFNYNVHQGAAFVIARRGQGLSDRKMPKKSVCEVQQNYMCFDVPVDTLKDETYKYLQKVSAAYNKWYIEIRDMLSLQRCGQIQFDTEIPF